MAVKLSNYLWLRNNKLVPLIEDPYREPKLSSDDKKKLKAIVDYIDELHFNTCQHSNEPIIGSNVILPGYVEFIEESRNARLSARLFERIHEILRKYWVEPDIYRLLGRSFEEIGIETPADIKEAFDYAIGLKHEVELGIHDHSQWMCWESIRRMQHERQ